MNQPIQGWPQQQAYPIQQVQQPQQVQYAQAPQYAPQPQVSYAPPMLAQRKLTQEEEAMLLGGLQTANAEGRFPKLEPGNHLIKITDVSPITPTQFGNSIFIEHEVLQSHVPGVSGMRVIKINGFGDVQKQKYALDDLKNFMVGALTPKGLNAQWQGNWAHAHIQCRTEGKYIGCVVVVTGAIKQFKKIDPATGRPFEGAKYAFQPYTPAPPSV